ncbi:MAG: radical SAM protein [Methanocalculus sp. MSAO_Arc1]|uniref:radical SAM/SPASM domain-containing protein n=1 Tax=Methanocalculus TaxID=71151 RepID=UPI000FF5F4EC|nr:MULTISPECIES: radical SAM protein [unclassified Methanocalculus]MCP1662158.1 radical SAM protein with 4Fe4S-binding SPASM domain [Methanocalculus sp. AMF5]RQD79111.1 MAG: radical SAM protein [Methanocalculus sp. MSAO_Arc1]
MHKPDTTPRLISWNITLRCPLGCSHCYVDAGNREPDGVLQTEEAKEVIDQIRDVGSPLLILSGGEPLLREDLTELAAYGTEQGLRIAIGTSGYTLDQQMAVRLADAGVLAAAISLDSTDPDVHDSFRGVKGAWERAVSAIDACHDAGIRVQINMTVVRPQRAAIDAVIGFGEEKGVADYHLFFPVHTGRGHSISLRSPEEYEKIIRDVLLHHSRDGITIRPTCAPQFRRIADEIGIRNDAWGRGCLAGITYCRIYANGDVTPCPYLPVSAGNLRNTTFKEIWNSSELFHALRNQDNLTGRCGICSYRTICGGCRARAYQGHAETRWCDGLREPGPVSRDILAEDPLCWYQPGEEADT